VTAPDGEPTGEPSRDSLGNWSYRSVVATMFPLLLALSILELGSGYVLESLEETYLDEPALLMLVPVMIGMSGNLGAILSARLSTRVHLGTVSFEVRDPVLWTNAAAIVALAVSIFSALAVVAYGVGHLLGSPMPLADLVAISLGSGLALALVAIALSVAATYVSYRRGYDPDDTTIPVVTNLCDVLGVLILSGVALLVL